MDPILNFLLSSFFKLIPPLSIWSKSKLEKSFEVYRKARELGVENKRDDFNYCYLEALYRLLENNSKDRVIIKLFAIKEVENAFRLELYERNNISFSLMLEHHLHTNSVVRELKERIVDIDREVLEFRIEFNKVIQETRKPKDIEMLNKMDEVIHILNSPVSVRQEFIEDLDFPKDLMNSYNHRQALDFLENFRKNKWNVVDNTLKYKIIANIGICKLYMNDEIGSAEYLIESAKYAPNEAKALGFAAIGYTFLNNSEQASLHAERAIIIDPEIQNAWVALISITNTSKEIDQIVNRMPASIFVSSAVAYSLSRFYRNIGDKQNAIRILSESIAISKNDPQVLAALGTLLLEEFRDPFLIKTKQVGSDLIEQVKKGIDLLTEAIDLIKDSDTKKFKSVWFVNRGIAKKILDDYVGALEDIRQAYDLDTFNFLNTRHLAICYMENENYLEANRYFEKLSAEHEHDSTTDLIWCECLIKLNKIDLTFEKLKSITQNITVEKEIKEQAYSLLVSLSYKHHGFTNAFTIAQYNVNSDSSSISYMLDLSNVYFKNNDFDKANESIKKAFHLIEENTENVIVLRTADLLYKFRIYDLAANLLSRLTSINVVSPINRQLLVSVYRSGDLKKCLTIIEKMKAIGQECEETFEIESSILELKGDLKTAIKVSNNGIQHYPTDPALLLKLCNLYFRVRDRVNLEYALSLIKDFNTFPIPQRFRLAYLYGWTGNKEKAMEIAYVARRDGYSDGKTHSDFINIVFHLKLNWEELLNCNEVKLNSAVVLNSTSEDILTFIILNYTDLQSDKGELSMVDSIAQKLLGKSVGDEIEIDRNSWENKKYTIASITHKFAYANKNSLELLQRTFITTEGFASFSIDDKANADDPFKPINDIIDTQSKYDDQLFEYYKNNQVPIGSIASLKKKSPVYIWGWIINSSLRLNTVCSDPNEYFQAISLLEDTHKILLDVISILTLSELEQLSIVSQLNLKVYVANSTVDIFRELLLESEGQVEHITVGKIEGHKFKREITKDEISKNTAYYKSILTWIEEKCIVVPCEALLNLEQSEIEKFTNIFGHSFFETELIAKSEGIVVLSDDGIWRSYLSQEKEIVGISCSGLLHYAMKMEVVDNNIFSHCIARLYSFGYRGLYISADILWAGLEKSNFSIGHPFKVMLEDLSNSSSAEKMLSLDSISSFIYDIYTIIHIKETQDILCSAIVSAYIGKTDSALLVMLSVRLNSRFFLLPRELARVKEVINHFAITQIS